MKVVELEWYPYPKVEPNHTGYYFLTLSDKDGVKKIVRHAKWDMEEGHSKGWVELACPSDYNVIAWADWFEIKPY